MSACKKYPGKIRYRDELDAKIALAGFSAKSLRGQRRDREGLRPYRCDSCHGWHLGNWGRK